MSLQRKRIVIKIGTKVLIDPMGEPRYDIVQALAKTVSQFHSENIELILVVSGAIGFGKKSFKDISSNQLSLEKKQALAAIGQPILMNLFKTCFDQHGVKIAQMLVTNKELNDRQGYLNLKSCLNEVLSLKAIPIINENDSVSTLELEEFDGKSFGDNDMLSSLIAIKLNADALILMTDTDGVYQNWGKENQALIESINDIVEFEKNFIDKGSNELGRGGMSSKIKAAKVASLCSIPVTITNGLKPEALAQILSGEHHPHTLIPPVQSKLSSKRMWLGFSTGSTGSVVINEGAKLAVEQKGASLLPVGIVQVKGQFKAGDVVQIYDTNGFEVGRGLAVYDSKHVNKMKSKNTEQLAGQLINDKHEFIHRDNMVIFASIKGYKS